MSKRAAHIPAVDSDLTGIFVAVSGSGTASTVSARQQHAHCARGNPGLRQIHRTTQSAVQIVRGQTGILRPWLHERARLEHLACEQPSSCSTSDSHPSADNQACRDQASTGNWAVEFTTLTSVKIPRSVGRREQGECSGATDRNTAEGSQFLRHCGRSREPRRRTS